jgi:RNA polymerase sigma factor (sigma-70 family)
MPTEWNALVAALQASLADREAGDALLQLVYREVRKLRMPSEVDRDDVVQNVMMRLLSDVAKLAEVLYPAGYLRLLLLHEVVNSLRRTRSFEELDVDRFEGPEAMSLQQAESRSLVRQAVAALSDAERELIDLKFWRLKTIGEIAGTLGISYEAAAVRIFRLLKKLRNNRLLKELAALEV